MPVLEIVDVCDAAAERDIVVETDDVFEGRDDSVRVGLTRDDIEYIFVFVPFVLAEFDGDRVGVKDPRGLNVLSNVKDCTDETLVVYVGEPETLEDAVLHADRDELAVILLETMAVGEFAEEAPTLLDVVADFVGRIDAVYVVDDVPVFVAAIVRVSVRVPLRVYERSGLAEEERVLIDVAVPVPDKVPVFDDVIDRLIDALAVAELLRIDESVPVLVRNIVLEFGIDTDALGDAVELLEP